MGWVLARLCKLQKGCTRLSASSVKVYQLFAHGRWFSPGTPASSTTKTGCHDIAESGIKHNQNQNQIHGNSGRVKHKVVTKYRFDQNQIHGNIENRVT